MANTYQPADLLTLTANGKRIDWGATQTKVVQWVSRHAQSASTGAIESADIMADLKKLVKKHTAHSIIAALKMDIEDQKEKVTP